MSALGYGWYVDKIEVEQLESGRVFTFPCFNWLGMNEDGSGHGPSLMRLVPQPGGLSAAELKQVSESAAAAAAISSSPISLTTAAMCLPRPRRDQVMISFS